MTDPWWILAVGSVLLVAVMMLLWRPKRAAVSKGALFADYCRDFHIQREHLEAKFIQLAQQHAGAGLLLWSECDFDDDVSYVKNRSTGQLSAFVSLCVPTNEGAVRNRGLSSENLMYATAIFFWNRGVWETDGRAIFNLTPTEAIRCYRHDLLLVGRELARRS